MPEMSRGEMMRHLDQASKDVLKRLVGGRGSLASRVASLLPSEADDQRDAAAEEPTTNIVGHLDQSDIETDRP
jgi:hypothetical protein